MEHIRNRYFLALDILFIVFVPFLALTLRVELAKVPIFITVEFFIFLLIALVVKLGIFYLFGLYARYWRFASVDEMFSMIWSTGLTTAIMVGWTVAEKQWDFLPGFGVPMSLPVIDGILTFLFVGGSRFSARAMSNRNARLKDHMEARNALVIGAGEMGVSLYRALEREPSGHISPVGFLDDDPRKRNIIVGGARVLGAIEDLPEIVSAYSVEEIIIAIPNAPGTRIKQIVDLCETVQITPKTVPSLNDIIHGHVSISALRSINIEDLLRRDPVVIDNQNVTRMLCGKRVMVTGAGGSIGSELCRQIAECKPALLILLGHGENSLYTIHLELGRLHPNLAMEIVVADLRDRPRLEQVFSLHQPEFVFHAAAHKHVPMMETNVTEAVTNNVGGTRNLLQVSEAHNVSSFVTISSDKAVNPTNIMGTTKRITEFLVRATGFRMGRPYVSVRFGNVLGSRGSVVPLFKQQISNGGPVTVTHKDMTRFFMTIPEATQLVLQSCQLGNQGDVFVLDMGEPVRIVDLANHLIELSGKRPGIDVQITFTGLRKGEKMHEELFGGQEQASRTEHRKIFRAPNQELRDDLDQQIDRLIELATSGDEDGVLSQLKELVPEFERATIDS